MCRVPTAKVTGGGTADSAAGSARRRGVVGGVGTATLTVARLCPFRDPVSCVVLVRLCAPLGCVEWPARAGGGMEADGLCKEELARRYVELVHEAAAAAAPVELEGVAEAV